MKKLISWIASAFQEEGGKISSKRINGYWAMIVLSFMAKEQVSHIEYEPNETLLLSMVGIVLFSIGAVSANAMSKMYSKSGDKQP